MNSIIAVRAATLLRCSALRAGSNTQRQFATKSITTAPRAGLVPNDFLRGWYNMFAKSTAKYATWVVILVVAGELALGKARDYLWEMNNRGRTFKSADWSKFDQFDEDDEEGEDDDDEEEGGEDEASEEEEEDDE